MQDISKTGNERAPEGHVFMCGACGKVSRWHYGFDLSNKNDATPGWDESCVMNCVLVPENAIALPVGWTYPVRVRALDPARAPRLDAKSGGTER